MATTDLSEATQRALLEAVREAKMVLTGDGRVSEADAAALLATTAKYLGQLRCEGRGPKSYAIGVGGGRVSYRLSDLAEWIEGNREN